MGDSGEVLEHPEQSHTAHLGPQGQGLESTECLLLLQGAVAEGFIALYEEQSCPFFSLCSSTPFTQFKVFIEYVHE